jgi:hypothetical protein
MKEIKCGSITVTFFQHDAEIHLKSKRMTFKIPKVKDWTLLEATLEALPDEKSREQTMGGFLATLLEQVIHEDLYPLRS